MRLAVILTMTASLVVPAAAEEISLVDVRRIWDQAPHNAFTDLIRHNGRWWCVFREGSTHVSPDGKLRVLTSADGEKWESAALISSAKGDLRDAKITVAPDGRLMLAGAVALPPDSAERHRSLVWFSKDGREWSDAQPVADPNYWLWRVTWQGSSAYGIGYATAPGKRGVRLYKGDDKARFETLVADLGIEGYPNESAIRFVPDGTAYCLLRRDPVKETPAAATNALLGISHPPYRVWDWKDTGARVGGPDFRILDGNRAIAVVRLYDGGSRTSVCRLDLRSGELKEVLRLPSGGDSSYAGMVMDGKMLLVSYYSSHEGKTSIYIARLRVP